MKNKRIIAAIAITGIALSWITYTYANEGISTKISSKEYSRDWLMKGMKMKWGHMGWGHMKKGYKMWLNLTDEEQTSLETMTNDEKKAFFELKREEMKLVKEQRENVIDKLLAWTELNNEEQLIRADIIEQRAERKLKQEEMRDKRNEMRKIYEK